MLRTERRPGPGRGAAPSGEAAGRAEGHDEHRVVDLLVVQQCAVAIVERRARWRVHLVERVVGWVEHLHLLLLAMRGGGGGRLAAVEHLVEDLVVPLDAEFDDHPERRLALRGCGRGRQRCGLGEVGARRGAGSVKESGRVGHGAHHYVAHWV